MIIQCPDCKAKMRPKPPGGTREGVKVSVTCRCGTKLRFTMPGQPKRDYRMLPENPFKDMAEAINALRTD